MRLILLVTLCMVAFAENAYSLNISLSVKESEGISRNNEMVHNGIPIAKSEAITSTSSLVITNDTGTQIPATFDVLSRWNGDPDDTAKEIQWLLISFPASVNANQTVTYYLKTGTPENVASPISLTNGASTLTVDTGPAEFVISKTSLTLFDSVLLNGTSLLSSGGGASSTINGQSAASANTPTLVEIERSSDNYVCIKVEGKYANTNVNNQPIYYRYRYEFYAGSPTAIVTHKFWWPGYGVQYDEKITMDSVVNTLPVLSGLSSAEVYADPSTYRTGALSSGLAKVEQKRKTLFSDSSTAVVTHGVNTSTTTFATRPMLLAKNTNGTIAVSLDHMHRFEPQALEVTSGGNIKVSPLAEGQFLAWCQGAWARFSISALPTSATYSDSLTSTFAPLNSRLFAFPSASYVKTTKVFGDIPLTTEGTVAAGFINKIADIADYSLMFMETNKWQGLMTWGSMTRYPTELGSETGWNKIYSGAALTDYHNTNTNYLFDFINRGNAGQLYDFSFNAARRMLNTQIIQPDTAISNTRMGWGFSGYGNYRMDQNSSHSYFENLYAYYYLTGDKEVTDILKIAGSTLKTWYTRSGGNLAAQDSYVQDFVTYTGRVGMQAAAIFNFLGHAYDSAYLDDFEYMFRHAFSQESVVLNGADGKEYAFPLLKGALDGTVTTELGWMSSMYFLPYLQILYRERGDLQLGTSNVLISRYLKGAANAYKRYHAPAGSAWPGSWWTSVDITYSGNAVGGTITGASQGTGSDPTLYDTSKASVAAFISQAGRVTNDQDLIDFGKVGIDYLIASTYYSSASSVPFAKEHGIFFTRLHGGVGNYYDSPPSQGKRYRYLSISDN